MVEQVPEPVRSEILFQHEVLQVMLGNVIDAAQRVLHGEAVAHELRDAERTLCDTLLGHLRQEERALGACGGARSISAELHDLHERSLHALERRHGHDVAESARAALRLAQTLQAVLANEDRELLASPRRYDA